MRRSVHFGGFLAAALVLAGCGSETGGSASSSAGGSAGVDSEPGAQGSLSTGNSELVGQPAPDFTLPTNTGDEVTLSDAVKEGPVVMVFYRGHWCPFCQTQLADYRKGEATFREAGAKVFLISVERSADLTKMQERHSMTGETFAFLSDSDKTAGTAYGGFTEDGSVHVPAVYVVDGSGNVVYGYSESDYKVRAAFADVVAAVEGAS